MTEPKQEIHCSVQNCHYWSKGNRCQADKILVTADTVGASQPESYDVEMAAEISPTPAESCMQTCCKTFVSKGDYRTDSVKKMP